MESTLNTIIGKWFDANEADIKEVMREVVTSSMETPLRVHTWSGRGGLQLSLETNDVDTEAWSVREAMDNPSSTYATYISGAGMWYTTWYETAYDNIVALFPDIEDLQSGDINEDDLYTLTHDIVVDYIDEVMCDEAKYWKTEKKEK